MARTNTSQQAFDKWVVKFGEPTTEVAKLLEQARATGEQNTDRKNAPERCEQVLSRCEAELNKDFAHREAVREVKLS